MTDTSENLASSIPDNSKWLEAASFLAAVRERQRHRGKTLSGRNRLSGSERAILADALRDEDNVRAAAHASDASGKVAEHLFEYFGEMCRRNHMVIPAESRKDILFILAVELLANMEHLDADSVKLIPATVQHGVLGLHQNPAFAAIGDLPYVFKLAAINFPSDPEGFLIDALAEIERLARDDRFASLRETPGMYARAAVMHSSDPERFLTKVTANLDRLQRDDRFAALHNSPYVFKAAVVNYPSNPEGFLTNVIENIKRLESDERFAALRETPHLFKEAAVGYPSDPDGFLTKELADIERFESEERSTSPRRARSRSRHATVNHSADSETNFTKTLSRPPTTRNGR